MTRSALRAVVGAFVAAAIAGATPGPTRAADPATLIDQQCSTCHGRNGVSTESHIPTIAGYSSKYLAESMRNFRKNIRACAEVSVVSGPKKGTKTDMCKISKELAEADIDALAKYLSNQRFVRAKQPFDAAKAQKGASVYKLRCEKCHENNGSSPDEDNGILAGQWTPYLRDQLVNFRTGKRPIDDKMKQRLDKVTKEDEDAVLNFFASQQ
jgi:sulfide dehydrogenase cytochrome subunit